MEPVKIERDLELDLPLDEAWSLICNSDGLASWLADEVDVSIEAGQEGTMVDDGLTRTVRVDRVIADREVAFTWWADDNPSGASTVVIEVEPGDRGGSRLHITETMSAEASADGGVDSHVRWSLRVLLLSCVASSARCCVAG